jgi:hypothetical protein
MSEWLRTRTPPIKEGAIIHAKKAFPYGTRREMLNVHLYFVKLFGGHIVDDDVRIEIRGFSKALLTETAHPLVYLRFGCDRVRAKSTGMSNLHAAIDPAGACAFATWTYWVDNLMVDIMFAKDDWPDRELLKGSWHPRFATDRLVLVGRDA